MTKNIVILGAGFGGLRAARQIHKHLKRSALLKKYQIFLIDKNDFHSFTPLWYEIATTSREVADNLKLKSLVAYPLPDLLRNKEIKFLKNEVQKIDLPGGSVIFDDSELKFDYLILALGSETNYFDIPGLKENSLAFKSFNDAVAVRDAIWDAVLARRDSPAKELKDLQIIIGGGGSTGVELAGEIKSWACELQEELGPTCGIQVAVVERAPIILTGFSERVINKVKTRLLKLDVKIMNGEAINKVIPQAVVLENGKILPFDILIWTGGVKTPAILQKLSLNYDERKRIKTSLALECLPENKKIKFAGKIFAVGDIVAGAQQVVQVAISQADVAAYNIFEEIKRGENLLKSRSLRNYKPKNYPYIIPVCGKFAVAKIGPFVISGFWAWILKGLVELNYLISIMPDWKAAKIWLRGLLVFVKNDRLG